MVLKFERAVRGFEHMASFRVELGIRGYSFRELLAVLRVS
jgi:hypothetical protein